MIIAKNFFISCRETVFHSANTDLGDREPSCFFFVYLLLCILVCFLAYMFEHFWAEEYFKYIQGRAVLSYSEIFIYPWYTGECRFLNRLNFFFPASLKICICLFRKGPVFSLHASVRFWLHNFLFLFLAAAAAAAKG